MRINFTSITTAEPGQCDLVPQRREAGPRRHQRQEHEKSSFLNTALIHRTIKSLNFTRHAVVFKIKDLNRKQITKPVPTSTPHYQVLKKIQTLAAAFAAPEIWLSVLFPIKVLKWEDASVPFLLLRVYYSVLLPK